MNGIIPPLVTPLLDQNTLDLESLERVIEHVIAGGVSGLFVLGSTGEGPSLSYALREQVIRESCRLARGRVPVLACITDTSLVESLALAKKAADAGSMALVAAPPFYFNYSQADLTAYMEGLIAALPLPLYLYNMPGLTKVAFEVDTVRKLALNRGVAGLKDSSGDLDYLSAAIEATKGREDFSVLIGPEELLANGMRLGLKGGVCGGANLHPELFVGIYEAAARGDWAEADRLQGRSRDMSEAIYSSGYAGNSYLRGLKASMARAGLCRNILAPPLAAFSTEECVVLAKREDAWKASAKPA